MNLLILSKVNLNTILKSKSQNMMWFYIWSSSMIWNSSMS